MTPRVAYLGPAGTFSEAAAIQAFPDAEYLAETSGDAAAQRVIRGEATHAVLPIENSLEGAVTTTLDLLIRETALSICGETVLDVKQCLMVRPGVDPAAITTIYSHPQSLGQCRGFLERNYPQARLVAALSNASAVVIVMESEEPSGAIGPELAATIYGATVVAAGIQDASNNQTRFVHVALQDHPPTGRDKTSLAFGSFQDRPGALVAVLNVFADAGINLTKIESRPSRDYLGHYVFLVDMEGHRTDPVVGPALEQIRTMVTGLRVFGSYPRA